MPVGLDLRIIAGVTEALVQAAVYRRTVQVSLERVWENARDWEHLPWLHASSFSAIDFQEEGDWGWRARVTLQSEDAGNVIGIELLTDEPALRYVTRTVEGAGRGTEIWTVLEPKDDDITDIEVQFHLPASVGSQAPRLGQAYVALYAHLWDEDEAMMLRRTAELASRGDRSHDPVSLDLGPSDELRKTLPRTVDFGGHRFRIVDLEGDLVVHSASCPHWLGPLDGCEVENGFIICPWHGYRFDARTGESADGHKLRLAAAPRLAVDPETGRVRLESASSKPGGGPEASYAQARFP